MPTTRTLLRTVAVALVAVTVSACGGAAASDDTSSGEGGRTAASGVCDAEERPQLQAGSHLIGDTAPPVPYSSVPPTSGWHASGVPDPGVHDTPLTDPEVVALLEIGHVVAVYDPAQLDPAAIEELERLADAAHAGRLSVTPSTTELPTPLTLTAWGVLQRCATVSPDAVTNFVLSHYGQTEAQH